MRLQRVDEPIDDGVRYAWQELEVGMGDDDHGFRAGDALISIKDCLAPFDSYRREFDVLGALDLCAGLDAAILYERLWITSPGDAISPVGRALLDEGVLAELDPSYLQVSDLETHPRAGYLRKVAIVVRSGIIEANPKSVEMLEWVIASLANVSRGMAVEDRLELSPALSAMDSLTYAVHPDIAAEREAFQGLRTHLASLNKVLGEHLQELRAQTSDEDLLPVPPLALQILCNSDTEEEVAARVLEARKQYAKVRSYFTEIDQHLRAGDMSLRKKLAEQAKLQKAVMQLLPKGHLDRSTITSSFAKGLNAAIKLEPGLADGVDAASFRWDKIVGWLIERGEAAYWRFRLRPLHALKKSYLELSNADIQVAVKKHFDHEIGPADHDRLNGFGQISRQMRRIVEQIENSA